MTIEKSLCFLEEVSWPVRPFCRLWGRAEIYLQLHSYLQRFQTGGPDDAGKLDSFRHLDDSYSVGGHVFELWGRDMNYRVGYEFSMWGELDPFNA